jgi:hypothetical protein
MPVEFAANEKVLGRTQQELDTEWWQWLMGVSPRLRPSLDESGVNCGVDQQGPVWFLSGSASNGAVHRMCQIPAGKVLFFPLISIAAWPPLNAKPDCDCSCNYEQAIAAENNETASTLFVELDGIPLKGLSSHHLATTECFDLYAKSADGDSTGYPTTSDGYWIALKPLKAGQHHLKFGAQYNNDSDPALGHLTQDIEYTLIVR